MSEPQAPPDAIAASPAAPWSGLLAVDKPLGVTSHDVVEKVRRRLKAKGAGHLGTLDPGASGLLLLALGAATRCIPVWQGGEKTYEGTLELGVITSTQDLQGEVLERRPLTVSEAAVREAALAFVGETEQIPPMVSALRSHGRRLYELARRGEEVERAPRKVRVTEWTWLEFALPLARFRVRCSGGTYVRTLAHDLGQRLGTGAALKALRRLRSEPFGIERAVALSEIGVGERDALLARAGIPLDEALGTLPALRLGAADAVVLGHGGRPTLARADAVAADVPIDAGPRSVVLRALTGEALALGEVATDPEDPARVRICPHVVLPWAVKQGRW